MKRILNEETKGGSSSREIVLGDDAFDEPEPVIPEPIISIDELPKRVLGASLKDLDGYRDLRKQKKIEKLENDFVSELSKVMKLFENDEKKYDSQVVQFVAQLAEHFFITHKKMGDSKERAVIQVVKKFYNNDEELVRSIIKLILPLIKKTNILRRTSSRLQRLFLYVLTRLIR